MDERRPWNYSVKGLEKGGVKIRRGRSVSAAKSVSVTASRFKESPVLETCKAS